MRLKQVPAFVFVFCLASPAALAEPGKDRQHGPQNNTGDVQIIIRKPSDRKPAAANAIGNADSKPEHDDNRQSDPDSVKGLERAQERHDAHANAQAGNEKDDGWYEYLFGKKPSSADKSERDWYGYLFGKRQTPDGDNNNGDPPQDKEDKPDNWWWPFGD